VLRKVDDFPFQIEHRLVAEGAHSLEELPIRYVPLTDSFCAPAIDILERPAFSDEAVQVEADGLGSLHQSERLSANHPRINMAEEVPVRFGIYVLGKPLDQTRRVFPCP